MSDKKKELIYLCERYPMLTVIVSPIQRRPHRLGSGVEVIPGKRAQFKKNLLTGVGEFRTSDPETIAKIRGCFSFKSGWIKEFDSEPKSPVKAGRQVRQGSVGSKDKPPADPPAPDDEPQSGGAVKTPKNKGGKKGKGKK